MNQNELLQYEYVLYVDLDSKGETYFQKMTNDVPENTEKFLIDLLKEDWECLERSKSEVYKSRNETIYLCIFEKLESFIKTNIIDKLPQNPIYIDRTKKVINLLIYLIMFVCFFFVLFRFWILIIFRRSFLKKVAIKNLSKA